MGSVANSNVIHEKFLCCFYRRFQFLWHIFAGNNLIVIFKNYEMIEILIDKKFRNISELAGFSIYLEYIMNREFSSFS